MSSVPSSLEEIEDEVVSVDLDVHHWYDGSVRAIKVVVTLKSGRIGTGISHSGRIPASRDIAIKKALEELYDEGAQ